MKQQQPFNQMLAVVGAKLAELRIKKGYSTIKEFTSKYNYRKSNIGESKKEKPISRSSHYSRS